MTRRSTPHVNSCSITGCSADSFLGQFIRAATLACPYKTVTSMHTVFAITSNTVLTALATGIVRIEFSLKQNAG